MKYKITKLSNGKFKVEETLPTAVETSDVDKTILQESIAKLESELSKIQAQLDLKNELLKEINKAK